MATLRAVPQISGNQAANGTDATSVDFTGGNPPSGGPPRMDDMDRIAKLEAMMPALATKVDVIELKSEMSKGFGELRADLHKVDAGMSRWMLGTVLTVIGTVVLGFAGLAIATFNALKQPAPAIPQQQPTVVIVPGAVAPAPAAPTSKP